MKTKLLAMVFATIFSVISGNMSVNAEETKTTPYNPVHECTGNWCEEVKTEYDYVQFGSYPQSQVVSEKVTDSIKNAFYDENGDAVVEGVKYRRIKSTPDYDTKYWGDGEYLYFKWEPLTWRVLQNDGNKLFLMADSAVDCQEYDSISRYVDWSMCDLRTWLNEEFYKTAFEAEEQNAILEQTLDNTVKDKVYLLSKEEAINSTYGFCAADINSKARQLRAYDYAEAKGVVCTTNDKEGYIETCDWWLRSSEGTKADRIVSSAGYPDYILNERHVFGVVPVVCVNVHSDSWTILNKQDVKVECIDIISDYQKVAVGTSISFNTRIYPSNASNLKVE